MAIDGTKMAANASMGRNLTEEDLRRIVTSILKEAERIDEEEDAKYGVGKRGDELPGHLKDPHQRDRWIEEQLAKLEQERKRREGDLHQPIKRRQTKPRVNTTDPDSSIMKGPYGAFMQAYNAQAVVTENQIVVAAEITNEVIDYGQLEPMVSTAQQNLLEIDESLAFDTVLADAGFLTDDNTELDLGCEMLIAPVAMWDFKELKPVDSPTPEVTEQERERYKRALEEREKLNQLRVETIGKLVDKKIDGKEAMRALNISGKPWLYKLAKRFREEGPDSVRRRDPIPKPRGPSSRERMTMKFLNDNVRETYMLRGQTIEAVFGQIKESRGIRRFSRRGFEACLAEWKLIAATHNLLKMWRHMTTPANAPGS